MGDISCKGNNIKFLEVSSLCGAVISKLLYFNHKNIITQHDTVIKLFNKFTQYISSTIQHDLDYYFDVSNLLHKMYQKIVESSEHLLGNDLSGLNIEWIPHCTLGKIRAPKSIVSDIGNKAIKDILQDNIKDII